MNKPFSRYRERFLDKPLINLLIIFISLTVLLSIVGFLYYESQKEKILNERFEYLGSIANFRMSQIEEWLKAKYAELEILKVSSHLNNIDGKKLISPSAVSQDVKDGFANLKKYYGYEDIILVDYKNKPIYSLSNSQQYISKTDSFLCQIAVDLNSIQFSDSNEKTALQEELKFYVPIKGRYISPESIVVLIVVLKPQKFFEPILNHNIDKSPTMESLLVKPFGEGVVYLNTLKFLNKETGSLSNNKALIETSTIKNRKGFVNGIDYKKDEVIAVIQKVPSTAWFLFTKINRSEFYEPVSSLGKIVFLAVTSADLLFVLVLFFIWRKSIVANYEKIYLAEIEKYKVEKRFESLVNGVRDIAIFILDAVGNITSWNEGAEKITGYSSKEIIGKHFSLLYLEKDNEQNMPANHLIESVEKGGIQNEGWRIRKDGSAFWVNSVITPFKDENGSVYGFLKITRDLTEKRKNEEEIKRSRDFYLKLLDDFPNPVWRAGLDGKCNYFNKAWLNYTGKTFEQEIGDGWLSNLHSEDKQKVIKEINDSYRIQKGFTLEYRLKSSYDEYRWFVVFGMPYYDFEGSLSGYLSSCYDIDDRIKYEDTINTLLRISEKLYSSLEINQILDSLVTECIQLTDAESGFACIKDENEFLTKRYYNTDHWEYLEKKYSSDNQIMQKFLTEKDSYFSNDAAAEKFIDQELIKKYGVKQILSTPLFDTNGELIGFFEIHNKKHKSTFKNEDANLLRAVARNASVAISKSINYEKLRQTEQQLRNSEAELRNLAAQIQYAREAERQHIAREVHDELGQLFTGINLNISLLAELFEQDNKPSVKEILAELHSVQEFVNKGIQTVRDISGSLRSYVLDHLGIIPAVQEYCREIERISNITCNFESEIESINLEDEKKVALFRIIQEALTNIVRHAEATMITIKITQPDNNFKIIISDDGKGMPKNQQSLSHSMGILGMKERAIFLGGKLRIESSAHKGTIIDLVIPMNKIITEEGKN